MKMKVRFSIVLFAICLGATLGYGQITANALVPAPKKKAPTFADKVDRWFDVQQLQLSTRYRMIENSKDVITNNQWQHKESFKFRFKLDPKANYTVNVGIFSGNSFTGSWNTTGVGTGNFVSNLYLKQFYFEAKPFKGIEGQYGSLYINRGEGTEAVSYDNDGYITGERLSLKRPKQLFFDEISATYGRLGDIKVPGFFNRYQSLGFSQCNYHQFLVDKKFGNRFGVSADYIYHAGARTLRQAIKIKTKELHFVDALLFENYERTNWKSAYGFNINGEKALNKRLTITPGIESVDRLYGTFKTYGPLNGDFYTTGNRVYMQATVNLTSEFSIASQVTQAFHNDYAVANRTRFDLALNYNMMKTLQKAGLLKTPAKSKK
jgi:hypothetical protein